MTDSEKATRGILKSDRRGRVRSTAAHRLAVLEQFERSGLSGPVFARVAGIAYQTFASWRHKHKRDAVALRSEVSGGRSVRLVEAVMTSPMCLEPASGGSLRINLPGGASMAIAEPMQVALAAQLIQALASSSSC